MAKGNATSQVCYSVMCQSISMGMGGGTVSDENDVDAFVDMVVTGVPQYVKVLTELKEIKETVLATRRKKKMGMLMHALMP